MTSWGSDGSLQTNPHPVSILYTFKITCGVERRWQAAEERCQWQWHFPPCDYTTPETKRAKSKNTLIYPPPLWFTQASLLLFQDTSSSHLLELDVLDHLGLIWTISIWRFRSSSSNAAFRFVFVTGSFYGIHPNKSVRKSEKKAALEGKSEKCWTECAYWSVGHLEVLIRPWMGFPGLRTLLISPSKLHMHGRKAEPPSRLYSQLSLTQEQLG